MKLVRAAEYRYIRKHLRQVRHITLDPKNPGVVRIHMVPPKAVFSRSIPYLLILNGKDILPVGLSWAIMLSRFMDELQPYEGREISPTELEIIISDTVKKTKKVYPAMTEPLIKQELETLLNTLKAVSGGKSPSENLKVISLAEYAQHMKAPHRIDLMISAMVKDGSWHCNQQCVHCYAAGQPGADVRELTTSEWKEAMAVLRKACIPQITFTGGEPTMRRDLVELVEAANWFITRLNTNGRLLTPTLCRDLYNASLDSVQVTLYSSDESIHNQLVGATGFQETVAGIKNAVDAGLNCSVNTPLCSLNSDYVSTLHFIRDLGVRYVTCSGLIPSGNALEENSLSTALSPEELKKILALATACCSGHHMEISFTSPGWLSPDEIHETGLKETPFCGACLSNMAIRPDGIVVPCQSWLSSSGLGNILTTPWKKIWNHPDCAAVRQKSAASDSCCQLYAGNKMKGACR